MEVVTPIVEQVATVKEFMNLRWTYKSLYIVPHRNSFRAYPLLKVSGWFNDTQNSPMMGTECQKIDQFTKGYLWFVSFENIFVSESEVFADYFV